VLAVIGTRAVEASVPRVDASAVPASASLRSTRYETAPPLSAPEDSAFALFSGDELARALALASTSSTSTPNEIDALTLGDIELASLGLDSSAHDERPTLHLGHDVFGLEPLRGPPESYPETRIGGLELFEPFREGGERRLTLRLLWGCEGISCGIAEEQPKDPLGLAESVRHADPEEVKKGSLALSVWFRPTGSSKDAYLYLSQHEGEALAFQAKIGNPLAKQAFESYYGVPASEVNISAGRLWLRLMDAHKVDMFFATVGSFIAATPEKAGTTAGAPSVNLADTRPSAPAKRVLIEGDAGFVGPSSNDSWTLSPRGEGAHLVERVNVADRPGLAAFDRRNTPRFYPNGTPDTAGRAHLRLHEATDRAGIERRGGNPAMSEDELLGRYQTAYYDRGLKGVRGDLRTPNGKVVIGKNLTPGEAYDALLRWGKKTATPPKPVAMAKSH